jgi:hypothetical protein
MITPRILRPILVASALALAGCAAGAAPFSAFVGFLSITLFLSACSSIKTLEVSDASTNSDTGTGDSGGPSDAAITGDAAWQDATVFDASADLGPASDAGAPVDAAPDGPYFGPTDGGTWHPCCGSEFELRSCFCPEGVACNYVALNCGDGICLSPREYTADECGGTTYDGCSDEGLLEKKYCPPGEVCEPATDCGDGLCAPPGTPVDECFGSWEACCVDGAFDSCYCPPSTVCNYIYVDCGDGTCATSRSGCGLIPIDPEPF